jgi:Tfp pilus assembly protein FimT
MTLIEVLAILAIIVVIGAVAFPSLLTMAGNTKQKAAADLVKSRIADARGRAIGDAKQYRLAMQGDGTRIRLAPDGPDFPNVTGGEGSFVTEDTFDKATASLDRNMADDMMSSDGSGWNTIATFLPDGTCRESNVTVLVHEEGFPDIHIYLRGLTGVTKTTNANGGRAP